MTTNGLIRAIVADQQTRSPPPRRSLTLALVAGGAVATALFLLLLGPRSGFPAILADPWVMLKLAAPALLTVVAIVLALRLARPGAAMSGLWALLALPVALVGAGILAEIALTSPAEWGARLVGSNALVCLTFVPVLAAAPLAAILAALRQAAPTRPGVTGAVAGLVAGGLAAFLYANHCTDDSPLFVATWYTLAIALVAGIGSLAGARLLRW